MPTLPEFEAMLPDKLDRMGAAKRRCGLCDRKMQGSWNHGEAYYRCRYASEYALPRQAQHPPTV